MLETTPPVEIVSLGEMRKRLEDEIYERTNGVVQDGPFKGMQMYPDKGWFETNIACELLGFFEQELQPDLEKEIQRLAGMERPKVVNVGCAEGYYAIGLGRRLPNAAIYAFDIDERSLYITQNNAKANGVQLTISSVEEAFDKADLIVMDCEGAEYEYLDPGKHDLSRATIIAELHYRLDTPKNELREGLFNRFHKTHSCKYVVEGARDPNRSDILYKKSSFEKWMIICEDRPCTMHWVVLRPYPVITRKCSPCAMCCTLERIDAVEKPRNKTCKHLGAANMCGIYEDRPAQCRSFHCMWLTDETMPEALQPHKIGAYAIASPENGYAVVQAAEWGNPDGLVEEITNRGMHAMVVRGDTISIVQGKDREMPTRMALDWIIR